MKKVLFLICTGLTASALVDGQTNSIAPAEVAKPVVETLVCIRHGEKPAGGLGQLTCRGLNRALALPKVLLAKYPAPQFVFAPNPAGKGDHDQYYYVRPLATIEPTAIHCGLPVNTQFGYKQIKELEEEFQKAAYQDATIYLAWEHTLLDDFAKDMLQTLGGDSTQVPAWPAEDYDTIFLIKITRDRGRESVAFTIDHEGLNDLSDDCP
jgi:hypothetical protein